jgi:uncharacterized protein (TIGR00730 family)
MSKTNKIRNPFNTKSWNEIKTKDSWQIFRIMAEFVDAFEKMTAIGPCVSIFGSARTKPGTPYYELGVEIAEKLTQKGYGIITGGGPGIMEAANKGAQQGGGKSVGLNIDLPGEQDHNDFIDRDKVLNFNYFFVRKVMFLKYGMGFIVLPGGFGTMDELFEALTLIQTEKTAKFPVVLVGISYWQGLVDWIRKEILETQENINKEDMDLFILVDTADEAVDHIVNYYSHSTLKPNF